MLTDSKGVYKGYGQVTLKHSALEAARRSYCVSLSFFLPLTSEGEKKRKQEREQNRKMTAAGDLLIIMIIINMIGL